MSRSSIDSNDSYWDDWKRQSLGCAMCELERCRRAFFNQTLRRHGFGAAQLPVLAHLWAGHDGAVQCNIAYDLAIDQATVTRAVHLLEDVGLVERRVDDGDARARRVWLTQPGREVASSVAEVTRRWNELVTEGWTTRRRAETLSALREMLVRVQTQQPGRSLPRLEASTTSLLTEMEPRVLGSHECEDPPGLPTKRPPGGS